MKRAHSDNDKTRRRDSILQSALQLFSQNGVDTTRMEDIARDADISKGTLYLYFNSKDDLFNALILDYAGGAATQITQTIQAEQDCRKALFVFADCIAYALVEQQVAKIIPLVIANAHRFPDVVSSYYENVIQVGLPTITEILQRGVKKGIFRPHDSEQYARLLFSPALMQVIFHTLFDNATPLKQSEIQSLLLAQLNMLLADLESNDVNQDNR